MDIKILFIFVGNKCALDYKKRAAICLILKACLPIHFDQFPALLLLYPLLASIVVCAGRQIHIHKCSLSDLVHVLNAFHSFQLSKPLNIS